jgi:hypothetical protein
MCPEKNNSSVSFDIQSPVDLQTTVFKNTKSAGDVLQGSYSLQVWQYDGDVLDFTIQEGGGQVFLFP